MTRRGDEGVAAVEMAIVLTLMLLLSFGAVPLWKMAGAYHKVSRVSAETLRFAEELTFSLSDIAGQIYQKFNIEFGTIAHWLPFRATKTGQVRCINAVTGCETFQIISQFKTPG